jgi:dienelactone hydrolase
MPDILPAAFLGPRGVLRGIIHRPEITTGRAPAVVLLHGFTGNHVEDQFLFVQMAHRLTEAGFAALRFDFYGSGDSDGTFDEMTIETEVGDAGRAVEWMSQQFGVDGDRIGVLGLSMGGCVAALLAGRDPRVKAAVFWNALCKPRDHFEDIPTTGPYPGMTGGLRVGPNFLPAMYACEPLEAVRSFRGPALIINGTGDLAVPPSEGDALKLALGERGEQHHIPGADHTFKHPEWRSMLFDLTIRWLREHLA